MEVTFNKVIEVSLDFDPEEIAKLCVEDYTTDGPLDDGIYDYLGDNIYYFLEQLGLSEEDWNAMTDMDYDVTEGLIEEAGKIIENKYSI